MNEEVTQFSFPVTLEKLDLQKGEIYFYMGETPDKRDEILDYDWSKPNLLKWLFNNKQ